MAAGDHPLFTAVGRVTVAGLAEEPTVQRGDARGDISATGLTATFRGAHVVRAVARLSVRLSAGRSTSVAR